MEIPKNALSWFEIPVHDFDRARKFYSTIFNYEMPDGHVGQLEVKLTCTSPEMKFHKL